MGPASIRDAVARETPPVPAAARPTDATREGVRERTQRRAAPSPPATGALRGAWHYLAVTHAAVGWRLYSIWALGLLAAAFEGFGILLFIPILSHMVEQDTRELPGLLAGSLDRFARGRSLEELLVLLVVLFALKNALVFALGVYRARVFSRVREQMRMDVFAALDRVRIGNVQSRRAGTLGNLLVREIEAAGFAMNRLCAALGAATSAALLFLVAVALNPALSLVLASSGALSLLLARTFSRIGMKISRDRTKHAGIMASLAMETVHAFKYLRATGRFAILKGAFGSSVRSTRHLENRAAVVNHLRQALREPLLVGWIAGIFYVFVVVLKQSLGAITDGILFFYRVSVELAIFQDQWHEVVNRVGSLDAYQRLSRELAEDAQPEDGIASLRFEDAIRLDGVTFAYGGVPVLRGVNIEIPKLCTVALVGASGVGKSTVVDLVAGCLEPTEGAVLVDGVDLRDLRRGEYRAALGYVTQESVMFSGSVARNVTMCWDAQIGQSELERARNAARLANCLEFIEALADGWNTEVGERGLRLSGGERQRIALARELYPGPLLLICDEATSALDSISEQVVQKSLELLHGQVTLLIVAHRLSTIRNADIVYVLDDGRVVQKGSFEELLRQPGCFRTLCEMQSLV